MKITITVEVDDKHPPRSFNVAFGPQTNKEGTMLTYPLQTIHDDKKVVITLHPKNLKNAAPIDGVPQWAVSDPNVVVLTVAADGLSAEAKAGATGHAEVTITGDADMGTGVETLTEVIPFDVIAANAKTLGATVGAEVDQ